MTAARNVAEIVERASANVAGTKKALALIDSQDTEHGVSAAIQRQSAAIARYHEALTQRIGSQQETAERAEENLQRITKAATAITNLTHEAHILSLNARIEAGRLGKAGAGFSVIAGEMQRLSKQITAANELINDLAQSLSKVLPAMTAGAREMRGESESFSQDLSHSVQEVQQATAELRDTVHQTLRDGDTTAATIIKASHKALSNLQFQDAVAQGLLRMDKWFWTIQRDQAADLGCEELASDIPPPAHIEIGDEKPVDQTNAGNVLLF
jgi:methyl-accepting chemotaxis protein